LIICVESNFLLEVAFEREQAAACESILRRFVNCMLKPNFKAGLAWVQSELAASP
jgi:hypothetical protein